MPNSIATSLSNQRGISLVAVGIWMTAFFALTAVGMDVARIAYTASEVQSASDVAALAGARAIVDGLNEQTAADTILGSGGSSPNIINGQSAYAGSTSRNVQRGTLDNAGNFTAVGAGAAANAVQATVVAPVENLFTGIFGAANGTTTITKISTAAFVGISETAPSLPMTIANGCFNTGGANCSAGNCPALNAQTNDAGFTSFFDNANQPNTERYLPPACRHPAGTGTATSPPLVRVNDTLQLNNGSVNNLFDDIQCMVCTMNMTEFVVPVIQKACGANFNQTALVVGFAKVTVDRTTYCAGSSTNVILQSVREADHPGNTAGGCTTCGYGQVRLF
jgi:hypothetical protein